LKEEIHRRSSLLYQSQGMKEPRPNGWTFNKVKDWLYANNVLQIADSNFLTYELNLFKQVVQLANTEQIEETEFFKEGNDTWLGPNPYLRLYHVLLDDNIRLAYCKKDDVLSRMEVDSRNNIARPKDFYELAADLFNDPSFNPTTKIYSDLHDDFNRSIELLYINAPRVTPQKIKEKMADIRAKLVIVIENWERSGNGNGMLSRNMDDPDYGNFEDCDLIDDNRANFLNGNKSHLLYFWQILDETQILQSTLCVLPKTVSASVDNIPATTISVKRKN
jgi:hypothetical protein